VTTERICADADTGSGGRLVLCLHRATMRNAVGLVSFKQPLFSVKLPLFSLVHNIIIVAIV
jgi:hypothetical protein